MNHGGKWQPKALLLRRIASSLTLEDVCRALREDGFKADRSTVSRWERGTRAPRDPRIVESLARCFACSVITFYRRPVLTYLEAEDD